MKTAAATKAEFNKGSARMFEAEWLERFSHVHPATPVVIYTPVILASALAALFLYDQPGWTVAWQVVVGYAAWTLTEYWLHRLVFHLPVRGPLTQRAYFYLHGVHHDWPWDTSRLVMPPGASLTLGALFYLGFRLAFSPGTAHALFAGLVTGYVIYDTIHWYTHAGTPKLRYFRFLRRQHMLHHFKEQDTRFGVSCPWWDFVFRTLGSSSSSASSSSASSSSASSSTTSPAASAGVSAGTSAR